MSSRFIAALLGTTWFLLGCRSPSGPETLLRIEARVLTPTVDAGDSAAVRVVAINPTSRGITVTSATSCHFYLRVYNALGEEVGRNRDGCLQSFTDLTVPAKDSVARTLYWKTLVAGNGSLVPAPPGDYAVRGILDIAVRASRWSAPRSMTVR